MSEDILDEDPTRFLFTPLGQRPQYRPSESRVWASDPHLSMSLDDVRQFREFPVLATERIEIQGQMLATLVDALAEEREINDRKAQLTQYAARTLVAGYAAVAAMAVTFALS